jgi:hypothetical protein
MTVTARDKAVPILVSVLAVLFTSDDACRKPYKRAHVTATIGASLDTG